MKRYFLIFFFFIWINQMNGQLKMIAPFEPQIFKGVNKTSVVYEIHLKDSLNRKIEIDEFTVKLGNKLLLNDSEFINHDFKNDTNRFLKNIWIDLDTLPVVLTNSIKCNINGKEIIIEKKLTINDKDLIEILPPFKDGRWFIAGGPNNSSYHRIVSQKVKSKYDADLDGFLLGYCNQRFAIDWIGLNDKYKFYDNQGKTNEDFYGYGMDVVAVADGKVLWVKNEIPDNIPPSYPDSIYAAETALGNCILLDIGDDIVAFYAHLIPNSINVKVGDNIKAGDVIGKLGNSGPSTGPHLHFDLRKKILKPFTKGLNRYYAQSISYVFSNYELIGIGADDNEDGELEGIFENKRMIKNKLPESDEIILLNQK